MEVNRPQKSEFRKKFEILSSPALMRINIWPRWVIPFGMFAFLLAGLIFPGVIGGVFISIVGLFVGWLLALSWPMLDSKSRILRFIVVSIIVISGLTQIFVVK